MTDGLCYVGLTNSGRAAQNQTSMVPDKAASRQIPDGLLRKGFHIEPVVKVLKSHSGTQASDFQTFAQDVGIAIYNLVLNQQNQKIQITESAIFSFPEP